MQFDLEIIVGDAEGVDTMVYNVARRMGIPIKVFGITKAARNGAEPYFQFGQNFYHRDRHMVEQSEKCVAIWNRYSRGAEYTFSYALKLNHPTVVYSADDFGPIVVRSTWEAAVFKDLLGA